MISVVLRYFLPPPRDSMQQAMQALALIDQVVVHIDNLRRGEDVLPGLFTQQLSQQELDLIVEIKQNLRVKPHEISDWKTKGYNATQELLVSS